MLVLGAYADDLADALAPELGARVLRVRDLVETAQEEDSALGAQVRRFLQERKLIPAARCRWRCLRARWTGRSRCSPTSRARRASCASSSARRARFMRTLRRSDANRRGGGAADASGRARARRRRRRGRARCGARRARRFWRRPRARHGARDCAGRAADGTRRRAVAVIAHDALGRAARPAAATRRLRPAVCAGGAVDRARHA